MLKTPRPAAGSRDGLRGLQHRIWVWIGIWKGIWKWEGMGSGRGRVTREAAPESLSEKRN
jgi:hypothetical protein